MGKPYTAPDGKTFRPSLFVTLTCPSYGRVDGGGEPADPVTYQYDRAARDVVTFAALFDRFIQNLRRYLGYDLQYFAAVEPQRRLAPHVHIAMRGTVSRAELRRVLAATYHQVWWPDTGTVKYDGDEVPVWDEAIGGYLDAATGEVLPTWDQTLDAIAAEDQPWHVARFGVRFDAQGVLTGSKDAARCIGYLTKYLTKHVGGCHQADTDAQRAHAAAICSAAAGPVMEPVMRCVNSSGFAWSTPAVTGIPLVASRYAGGKAAPGGAVVSWWGRSVDKRRVTAVSWRGWSRAGPRACAWRAAMSRARPGRGRRRR